MEGENNFLKSSSDLHTQINVKSFFKELESLGGIEGRKGRNNEIVFKFVYFFSFF